MSHIQLEGFFQVGARLPEARFNQLLPTGNSLEQTCVSPTPLCKSSITGSSCLSSPSQCPEYRPQLSRPAQHPPRKVHGAWPPPTPFHHLIPSPSPTVQTPTHEPTSSRFTQNTVLQSTPSVNPDDNNDEARSTQLVRVSYKYTKEPWFIMYLVMRK